MTRAFSESDWAAFRVLIGDDGESGLRMQAVRAGISRTLQEVHLLQLMRDVRAKHYSFALEVASLKKLLGIPDAPPEPRVEVSFFS